METAVKPDVQPIVAEQQNDIKPAQKPRAKRRSKHDFKDGRGRVFAHKHDNGGGWVEDTASVSDDVYIGRYSQVFNKAQVSGGAVLRGRSFISGSAVVSGRTRLYRNAAITGAANVVGRNRILGRIDGAAQIVGSSYVGPHCHVSGSAQIIEARLFDNVVVYGEAIVIRSDCGLTCTYEHDDASKNEHALKIYGRAQIHASNVQAFGNIYDRAQINTTNISSYRWRWRQNGSHEKLIICSNAILSFGSQLNNVAMQFGKDACLVRTHIADVFHDSGAAAYLPPIVLQEANLLDMTIHGLEQFRTEPWNAHKNGNFVAHANAAGALAESLVNNTSRKLQRV